MNNTEKIRLIEFDNIRGIMIILVVFGHLLESFLSGANEEIYQIIYSFHIPILLFISGYFAKCDRRKGIRNFLIPYFILQMIYLVFNGLLNHTGIRNIPFQIHTPFWILWFLFTLFLYSMILPFFDQGKNGKRVFITLMISLVVALGVGYVGSIGYKFSLSRAIVFFPVFLAGYYLSKRSDLYGKFKKKFGFYKWGVIGVILLFLIILWKANISNAMMYQSLNYVSAGGFVYQRAFLLAGYFLWTILFFGIVPRKEIRYLTSIGQNTMPIFLLHAFIVLILRKMNPFVFHPAINLILCGLMTIVIVSILSTPAAKKIVNLLTLQWVTFQKKKTHHN